MPNKRPNREDLEYRRPEARPWSTDAFNMVWKMPRRRPPSMGHHFNTDLVCGSCQAAWIKHQKKPTVCPTVAHLVSLWTEKVRLVGRTKYYNVAMFKKQPFGPDREFPK